MTLAEYFGSPSEPCLACGCPWSWTTTKGTPLLLCARCYPRRGTPADVWAQLKAMYSARRGVTVSTARIYEASFDERTLHGRRRGRPQSSDDCYDGNLWEVQS